MDSNKGENAGESPLKQLRTILRQFDSGEKRQWPYYLSELRLVFEVPSFQKNAQKKAFRVVEECSRVFSRVLTTKLFPDIIREVVKTIASLATVLGSHSRELFNWIFDLYYSTVSDDTRLVLLQSLALILQRNHEGISEHSSSLLSKVKRAFESTDNCELLIGLVKVFLASSVHNPQLMQFHFRDVVDILIGWHIDLAHSPTLRRQLSLSLIAFHRFWLQNRDFSFTLLANFVEDFDIHYAKLQTSQQQSSSQVRSTFANSTVELSDEAEEGGINVEDRLAKMGSLIQVHLTVLRCYLGNQIVVHNQRRQLNWNVIADSFQKFLIAGQLALKLLPCESFVVALNQSSLFILQLLHQNQLSKQIELVMEDLCAYLNLMLTTLNQADDEYICSAIQLTIFFARCKGASLDPRLVKDWLGPASPFQQLKFTPDQRLQRSYFSLCHELMNTNSIPLLEAGYGSILCELNYALSILLGDEFQPPSNASSMNAIKEIGNLLNYNEKSANIAVQSCLISLLRVGVAKHSLIGMWALNPTFFDLFSNYLQTCSSTFTTRFPKIQLQLLHILHSHCKLHSHYVSTSSLINTSASSEPSSVKLSFTFASPSASYLQRLLDILNELLCQEALPHANRLFCITWSLEIVQQCKTNALICLFKQETFTKLLRLVSLHCFCRSSQLTISSAQILLHCVAQARNELPQDILYTCKKACAINLDRCDVQVNKIHLQLLSLLPLNCDRVYNSFVSLPFGSSQLRFNQDCRQSNRTLMRSDRLCLLNNAGFREIWQWIIKMNVEDNQHHKSECSQFLKRFVRMFSSYESQSTVHSRQYLTKFDLTSCADTRSIDNWTQQHKQAFFWCCWELVKFCVLNKLRTPLGKPPDTFTKVELLIKQHALAVQRQSLSDTSSIQTKSIDQIAILLQMMENLDKLMCHAIQGGSSQLFSVPVNVQTFFITNKLTCHEWMQRIRLSLMAIAGKCGDWASVWRNAYELLREAKLRKLFIEPIIANVAVALIHLNSSSSIVGLRQWCKTTFDKKLNWLDGAAQEAEGKYEVAAKIYADQLLVCNDTKIPNLETKCIQEFLHTRRVQCELSLGRLNLALEYQNKLNIVLNQESHPTSKFSEAHLRALKVVFEEDNGFDFQSMVKVDVKLCENLMRWDIQSSQQQVESLLLSSMQQVSRLEPTESVKNLFEQAKTISGHCLNTLVDTSDLIGQRLHVLYRCSSQAIDLLDDFLNDSNSDYQMRSWINVNAQSVHQLDCATLIYTTQWWLALNHVFLKDSKNYSVDGGGLQDSWIHRIQFLIAKAARKSENYELAQNRLIQFGSELLQQKDRTRSVLNLIEQSKAAISSSFDHAAHNKLIDLFDFHYESSKLLHQLNLTSKSVDILLEDVTLGLETPLENDVQTVWSRMVLKLVRHIRTSATPNLGQQLTKEQKQRLEILTNKTKQWPELDQMDNFSIPEHEAIIGQLLGQCTQSNTSLAKAWLKMGDWSYKWANKQIATNDAKHSFDHKSSSNSFEQKDSFDLYRLAVRSYFRFLQLDFTSGKDHSVTSALRLLQILAKHWQELRDVFEEELHQTPIGTWKTVVLQLFARLGHPQTYVRQCIGDLLRKIGQEWPELIVFPAVNGAMSLESNDQPCLFLKKVSLLNEEKFVCPSVDEAGLDSLNQDEAIKNLIQDHNSPSKLAEDLLEKSSQRSDQLLERDIRGGNLNYHKHQNSFHHSISDCHKSILSTLKPELVMQTKRFVFELKRITLLWDELWLATLHLQYKELQRQVELLEEDCLRLNREMRLVSQDKRDRVMIERHSKAFERIVQCLERTERITSRTPQTPYEVWFQRNYAKLISDLIKSLRCPADPFKPNKQLISYQYLMQNLQTKVYRASRAQLLLDNISPALIALQGTNIPMPGASDQQRHVCIERVHKTGQTLHTKTKPKKIAFYGSDGKLHFFLLKGGEDLHLDERVMQLLTVTNQMFKRCSTSGKTIKSFQAMRSRNYSVTPLGSRSGLIQWVNGTSLFSICSRRLAAAKQQQLLQEQNKQRQQTASAATAQQATRGQLQLPKSAKKLSNPLPTATTSAATTTTTNAQPVAAKMEVLQKFSEIFESKLQLKGLKVGFRSEWPIDKLVEILEELIQETPSDLISKALWSSSCNAFEYWSMTQRFIQSNAVMCMVGYMIGLGDRHLDNLLLDMNTGEIIHIDYNICFERGQTLDVPERVPCRLTQNIVNAFGVTGIEGEFRLGCQHVLQTLRKGRETLLTLLEAFLYDPLFDCSSLDPNACNRSKQTVESSHEESWLRVWRRVKIKLDGRELDEKQRQDVDSQVQSIIEQATDKRNMSRMYEGWTPWV